VNCAKQLESKNAKKAKITVGITISPTLLAKAEKHNLNISRITEQAPKINSGLSTRSK